MATQDSNAKRERRYWMSQKPKELIKEGKLQVPPGRIPKYFYPNKGFKFVLGGYLYKITAARPNGKISARRVKPIPEDKLTPAGTLGGAKR